MLNYKKSLRGVRINRAIRFPLFILFFLLSTTGRAEQNFVKVTNIRPHNGEFFSEIKYEIQVNGKVTVVEVADDDGFATIATIEALIHSDGKRTGPIKNWVHHRAILEPSFKRARKVLGEAIDSEEDVKLKNKLEESRAKLDKIYKQLFADKGGTYDNIPDLTGWLQLQIAGLKNTDKKLAIVRQYAVKRKVGDKAVENLKDVSLGDLSIGKLGVYLGLTNFSRSRYCWIG